MLQVGARKLRLDRKTYEYDLVDIGTPRRWRTRAGCCCRRNQKQAVDAQGAFTIPHFEPTPGYISWICRISCWARSVFCLFGRALGFEFVPPWGPSTPRGKRPVSTYDCAAPSSRPWGDRKAQPKARELHDYGNKDWAGLTHDYYRLRWQDLLSRHSTRSSATGVLQASRSNWFELGRRLESRFSRPTPGPAGMGDSYVIARRHWRTRWI